MVDVGSRGSYALDGGATRSPQGPHVPTRRTGQIRRGCLDRVSEVVILTTVVVTVFRSIRHGRVELRQPLQTRELVQHEPHSPMTGLTAVHQPEHQHVQPETRERHEARARLWRARQEQPPTTVARPRRGAPTPRRLRFTREQLQRIGDHVERGEDTTPLRGRLAVDYRRVGRTVHAAIELLVVTEPRGQFLGGRPERQQVRKDATGTFREERILVHAIWEQRRRERERFRLVAQFVTKAPVR